MVTLSEFNKMSASEQKAMGYKPTAEATARETTGGVYQGPIAPGTSEEVFRATGKSVPISTGGVQDLFKVHYQKEQLQKKKHISEQQEKHLQKSVQERQQQQFQIQNILVKEIL